MLENSVKLGGVFTSSPIDKQAVSDFIRAHFTKGEQYSNIVLDNNGEYIILNMGSRQDNNYYLIIDSRQSEKRPDTIEAMNEVLAIANKFEKNEMVVIYEREYKTKQYGKTHMSIWFNDILPRDGVTNQYEINWIVDEKALAKNESNDVSYAA